MTLDWNNNSLQDDVLHSWDSANTWYSDLTWKGSTSVNEVLTNKWVAGEIVKTFTVTYNDLRNQLPNIDDYTFIWWDYLANGNITHSAWDQVTVYSPVFYSYISHWLRKDTELTWDTRIWHQQLLSVGLWTYPNMTESEIKYVLDTTVKAYNNGNWLWPSMSPEQRIECMNNFVLKVLTVKENIVDLLMLEIWKNKKVATAEFDRTIEYIRKTVDDYKDMIEEWRKMQNIDWTNYITNWTPTWPALCMGPYNYPFNETFTTLIPALLVWNPIIYKPAKFWVLFNYYLLDCFKESFPAWVVNVIFGEWQKIIPPIMTSWEIVNFAFIWSDKVADNIISMHPKKHILNPVLWLWAKNVWIIMKWCDIKETVKQCVAWSLSFNWQRCTALKLLYIHDDIYEEFMQEFLDQFSRLKFWNPFDPSSDLTPIPDPKHLDFLISLRDDALAAWAEIINECGWMVYWSYMHPAILTWVKKWMKIYDTEQFWPIVSFVRYSEMSEIKAYMNESRYWQQSSIFFGESSDLDEAKDMIKFLWNQVCRVNLNTQCQRSPDYLLFSWRKDSALRILSIRDALKVFAMPSLVTCSDNKLLSNLNGIV